MPRIGVPRETAAGETRVALIPSALAPLLKDKHEVFVQKGAGEGASFPDSEYARAGAVLVEDASSLASRSEVTVRVRPPRTPAEAALLGEGSTYVGFFAPLALPQVLEAFRARRITALSMEYIPRITRAQSMDALSSMATVAGYKAVLMAAEASGKMFPLLMTAAGTVPPATVLVLGAGVAGLQAIATAKRLGAKVEAYDVRAAAREQIKSLGATPIEIESAEDPEGKGGYAREQSAGFLRAQQAVLAARLPKIHVVITTAQVFGKKAPVLLTTEMVKLLHPGSVVVDLAAEQGGNCALTQPGQTVVHEGVRIIGTLNIPALVPQDASQMYSRNVLNLLKLMYPTADARPDFGDEILSGACITRNGEVTNTAVREARERGETQS
ncbi:MAG: Re/Si-specific NAD(P)(+) transhydrogenase subunit alpha [Bacteroidota bacterium]